MSDKPLTTDDDLYRLPTDQDLSRLQRTTVLYYLHETNPDNGLVRDKTDPTAPCSIAAVGMALATIPVVVERGVIIRKFAAKIARQPAPQPPRLPAGPGAGRRRVQGLLLPLPRHRDRPPRLASASCPRIDSAFLFAGVLTCRHLLRRATRPTRPRSAAWPTSSTAGPTGTGPATAVRR